VGIVAKFGSEPVSGHSGQFFGGVVLGVGLKKAKFAKWVPSSLASLSPTSTKTWLGAPGPGKTSRCILVGEIGSTGETCFLQDVKKRG
jgi:hypothetical protein